VEAKEKNCNICGDTAIKERTSDPNHSFFIMCNNCGNYIYDPPVYLSINKDYLASYLFYNAKLRFPENAPDYFTYIGSERERDYYNKNFPKAKLVTYDDIIDWYPKSFSEKIDMILSALGKLSIFMGDVIDTLSAPQFFSIFFIKRYVNNEKIPDCILVNQKRWLMDYFINNKYLDFNQLNNITVLPDGWKRIDELQKYQSNNKQAFIAIAFSDEMKEVQEAIEKGIRKAGFVPHVMNKNKHNNQIVPEILYQIRQSKFIIAEFTTNNNGAYYEAGYAAGLGKDVIHLCRKDEFEKDGHFDIKQKSTILWENTSEIEDNLCEHIKATIT